MRGWALGLMYIRPDELNVLPISVFWTAMKAREDEKEADRRHIGELVRGATLRLLNTQLKRPILDVRKFWRMPWDPEEVNDGAKILKAMPRAERLKLAQEFVDRMKSKEEDGNQGTQAGNNG